MFVWPLPRNLLALKSDRHSTPLTPTRNTSALSTMLPWSSCPALLHSHVGLWIYMFILKIHFHWFYIKTAEIQPICLAPSTEFDHSGDILHISGWGKPSDGIIIVNLTYWLFNLSNDTNLITAATGTSPVLHEVDVPCISNAECAAPYVATITAVNICVPTTGGKGSCNVRFL
jgi:hypothetical protein